MALEKQKKSQSFQLGTNGSIFASEGDCKPVPPNIHGDDAFLVKMQVPIANTATEDLASILVYDRHRSFVAHLPVKLTDPTKYNLIDYTCRNRGVGGLKMYRWAKRIGDWKLAICLDREPVDQMKW